MGRKERKGRQKDKKLSVCVPVYMCGCVVYVYMCVCAIYTVIYGVCIVQAERICFMWYLYVCERVCDRSAYVCMCESV